jgi:octaprenyl-diphosphate synthase
MQLLAPRAAPAGLHAPAPRRPPSPLGRALALVTDEMIAAEAHLAVLVGSTVPAVAAIGAHLAQAGGKRLRPLLTALGARAAGHTGDVSRLMCAGEVLHLGSLLHDDVVDGADERRGGPAAHRVYGNAGVILTGDVCLARAVRVAAEEGGPQAVLELSRAVEAMSEGEVIQLLRRGDLDLPLDAYFDIIDRKSAALIAWCAAAGAWAVGDAGAASALSRYGRAVGVAFQITDDVLDYTGDPAETGKAPGRDLAERKLTLPLLRALQLDPGLRRALGQPGADEAALLQRVLATGAPQRALDEARARVEAGTAALIEGLPPTPHRDALVGLGHHLVDRVR